MKKKVWSLALTLVLIAGLFGGCGSTGSKESSSAESPSASTSNPSSAQPATALTVGVLTDTDGFDPISTVNFLGCNLVYETLVDIDPDTSEPVGVLAEAWEYRDDTHLYVKLYDNAVFSSGNPVTSEDVYWSWYRNIENNSSNMNNFSFIDWDNWEIINDKEFVISYLEPFGPAINYMTMCCFSVVDKTAMENADSEVFWSAPVGSGPYTVVENVSGAYSSYRRNETYWNAAALPQASEVTVKNYSDASTLFIDFETGALDIAFDLDVTDADRVTAGSVDGAVLETIPTNNILSLAFPEYTEELSDLNVRKALAYALDVSALTELSYGSLGTVAVASLPSTVQYALDVGVQEYDPEYAKQLLQEAGYGDGQLDLSLVIVGSSTNERLATAIQAYFAAVGVTLQIESCDLATAISHFKNSETDIVIDSGSVVTMDPFEKLQMSLATSTNATIRITDPSFNEDLLAGKTSSDEAVRKQAYEEAQQWLADNYRLIPICETEFAYTYRSDKVASVNTMCDEAITVRYVELAG